MSTFGQTYHRGKYGIITRLEHLATDEQIVIVNTDLSWEEEYEFVKLCQVHYLLLNLEAFTRYRSGKIVFCGDLKSLPGNMVHKYLTEGRHHDDGLERKLRFGGMGHEYDYSRDYDLAVSRWLLYGRVCLFEFASAYADTTQEREQLYDECVQITTVTPSFEGCIDYIFVQLSRFDLKRRMALPASKMALPEMYHSEHLPSSRWPSPSPGSRVSSSCLLVHRHLSV